MNTAASNVTVWLWENSSTSGGTSSPNMPGPCASRLVSFRRAQILGEVGVVQPLDRLGRKPRHVGHHRPQHVGEVPVALREARAEPDDHDQQLRGHDHVDKREERHEDQCGEILLAAGRDEQHLVPQAEDHEQGDDGDDRRRCHEARIRAKRAVDSMHVDARQRQRNHQREQQRDIQQHVDRRALVAAGERDLVGPWCQPDRASPRVIVQPTAHRLEVTGQRSPGAGEAEALEQHRPQHRLLIEDRLEEPRRRM